MKPRDDRPFLQFNTLRSIEGKLTRLVGFAHPDLLFYLKYPQLSLFLDGTFKTAPAPFYQCLVFLIYDKALNLYFPAFYVLLPNKTQWTYFVAINEVLLSCGLELEPKYVHCDFESGLIGAILEQFPNVDLVGCLFHLKQAWLKRMKEYRVPKLEREKAISGGGLDLLTVIPLDEIEGTPLL